MKRTMKNVTGLAVGLMMLSGAMLCGGENGKSPAKKPAGMPAMPIPTVGVGKVFIAEDILVRNYVGQTVSLAVVNANIWVSVAFIGVVTFLLSGAGVKLGSVFGARYKTKAEIAGGVILILLGLKILLEHLGVL